MPAQTRVLFNTGCPICDTENCPGQRRTDAHALPIRITTSAESVASLVASPGYRASVATPTRTPASRRPNSPPAPRNPYYCGCKHTGNRPQRDGTHTKLT